MNDFTKDELVMLKRLTLHHVNQFRENSDCIKLMSKLRNLIDNYCEHTNKNYDVDGGITLVCSDCGCTLIDV